MTPLSRTEPRDLPVIVLGAGPVGLAAAAHLHARGQEALLLEAGARIGASVREWGHVRLFSPWRYLVDERAAELLERHGWAAPPEDEHPTGAQLVRDYLEPLAGLPEIAPGLRLSHRVTAVTRIGHDRMKTAGRGEAPFLVVARGPRGGEVRLRARAVIDATGTWTAPNPLGAAGIAAEGELEHAARIRYGIPDALGADRARYAGRRTLVVGGGHSAFNAVLGLAQLARETPGTEVVWAVRRGDPGTMFGGGADDALSERGALGRRARTLVAEGGAEFLTGFRVERIAREGDRLAVEAEDGRRIPADEIVAATGFRPDLSPTRELRLGLDPITEAPVRLAPLIDPNVHSCGTVPPHGEAELRHPEPGYYTVGMKSYGRAPTFLLLTGYEQVRSVVAHVDGDREAAARVELRLPETGVCSTSDAGGACCGVPAAAGDVRCAPEVEELQVVGSVGGCCG